MNTGPVGRREQRFSAPETTEIVISVEPPDAKVTRDGSDLGALPTSLRLKPGEIVVLEVTHAGYKTQKVTRSTGRSHGCSSGWSRRGEAGEAGDPEPAQQAGPAAGDFQDPFLKK